MNWRIYRLPGSREIWHIDSGPGTQVFNVRSYVCLAPSRSVDIGGDNVPRAWIQICGRYELHMIDGKAVFAEISVRKDLQESLKCAATPSA